MWDGSTLSNPGAAGFGGLIRDSLGTFVGGFYGSVGISNIMHAELMALLQGLTFCWNKGVRKVRCH